MHASLRDVKQRMGVAEVASTERQFFPGNPQRGGIGVCMARPTGPHPPGSFTKNFAWHGRGMLKLHAGIRAGFGGRPTPVTREDFRINSGFNDAEFLIAANFFLFNVITGRANRIPVDELVRHAIEEDHSLAFDRLGLFVLNLSLGGRRAGATNGSEFPTQWANEYVKQTLWSAGRWQRSALDEARMDADIFPRIRGVPDAKRKSRSNYRHVFELAQYIPGPPGSINTDPESWCAGALYLAWDRRLLSGGATPTPLSVNALIAGSRTEEDYKLLGITEHEFAAISEPIATEYALAGGLGRFDPTPRATVAGLLGTTPATAGTARPPRTPRGGGSLPTGSAPPPTFGWLSTAAATDAAVERQIAQRLSQKRNQALALELKRHYDFRCMACDAALIVAIGPERYYSEAAHIKPVGMPHNGPDAASNMIVLCPNHHLQFDRGVISLESRTDQKRFVSHIPGDPVHGRPLLLNAPHVLDQACVDWHAAFFASVTA